MMPTRIQRRRTKGWRMPACAAYVGRPTVFGNPWRRGAPGRLLWRMDGTEIDGCIRYGIDAGGDVSIFRLWLERGVDDDVADCLPGQLNARGLAACRSYLEARRSTVLSRLPDLAGRDLACWCPLDRWCHADVLLELANGGASGSR